MAQTALRCVPDTNVILAAHGPTEGSPNAEFLARWRADQFTLLYSDDTLREYIAKLQARRVDEQTILQFVAALLELGDGVEIRYFHLRYYPSDEDDIAFLLCATNGVATHIVTYDEHLLELQPHYPFTICQPVPFLRALRAELSDSD